MAFPKRFGSALLLPLDGPSTDSVTGLPHAWMKLVAAVPLPFLSAVRRTDAGRRCTAVVPFGSAADRLIQPPYTPGLLVQPVHARANLAYVDKRGTT